MLKKLILKEQKIEDTFKFANVIFDIKNKLGFKISLNFIMRWGSDAYIFAPNSNFSGQAQLRQIDGDNYILELFDNANVDVWKKYCKNDKHIWFIKIIGG